LRGFSILVSLAARVTSAAAIATTVVIAAIVKTTTTVVPIVSIWIRRVYRVCRNRLRNAESALKFSYVSRHGRGQIRILVALTTVKFKLRNLLLQFRNALLLTCAFHIAEFGDNTVSIIVGALDNVARVVVRGVLDVAESGRHVVVYAIDTTLDVAAAALELVAEAAQRAVNSVESLLDAVESLQRRNLLVAESGHHRVVECIRRIANSTFNARNSTGKVVVIEPFDNVSTCCGSVVAAAVVSATEAAEAIAVRNYHDVTPIAGTAATAIAVAIVAAPAAAAPCENDEQEDNPYPPCTIPAAEATVVATA